MFTEESIFKSSLVWCLSRAGNEWFSLVTKRKLWAKQFGADLKWEKEEKLMKSRKIRNFASSQTTIFCFYLK